MQANRPKSFCWIPHLGYSSPLLSGPAPEPSLFRIPLRLDLRRCSHASEKLAPAFIITSILFFLPRPESGYRPSSVGCGDQSELRRRGIKHRDYGIELRSDAGPSAVTFNGGAATATTWSASSVVSKVASGITSKSDRGTKSGVARNGTSGLFSVRPAPF